MIRRLMNMLATLQRAVGILFELRNDVSDIKRRMIEMSAREDKLAAAVGALTSAVHDRLAQVDAQVAAAIAAHEAEDDAAFERATTAITGLTAELKEKATTATDNTSPAATSA